jgi:O-antigen/teichoic acid export membrane protein
MNHEIQKQTSRSVFRNVVYGAFTWLAPLGLSFVATPVIVRSLGHNDYGIYALVLGFIAYSFSFALGRATTKYVAEYRISGQSEKIRDVISATFFLNIVVGAVAVAAICLLSGWLVRDVFLIEPAGRQKAVTALYLAAGIIFVTMLSQVFSAVLQGIQRFDVYSKILTLNNLVLISGNIALAYLGFGLVALLWWNLGVISVGCIVFGFAAARLLPEAGLSLRFERGAMRLVLRYSVAIIIYQALANLLLIFERGWITNRLGSESLTYYVVPMSLGMLMHGFVSSVVLVVFPLASELNTERERLLRLYTKATKVIAVLVVFIVASAVIHSDAFLGLWMGPTFAAQSSDLLVIHMICFGAVSIMAISFQMTEGLGYPQFNAATTGVATVVGISLMIVLISGMGNTGVALARLSAFGLIFFSILIVEKWFFKKVQARFWLGLLANLAVAVAAAAAVEYGVAKLMPVSWPSLILSIGCGGLVYVFVLWLLDFVTADEKLLIRAALGR